MPALVINIKKYIEYRTELYTYDWRAYKCVRRLGHNYYIVVHKRYFVDFFVRDQSNNLEVWEPLKIYFSRYKDSPGIVISNHMY